MTNHIMLAHFASNVVRLRMEAGLTQEALALRCEKFSAQVPHIEAGTVNPSLTMIVALAQALEVHPSTILNGIPHAAQSSDQPTGRMSASSVEVFESQFGNPGTDH